MKVLLLLFLIINCLLCTKVNAIEVETTEENPEQTVEEILNDAIEKLRVLMKTGDPDINFPVLAPFDAETFPINIQFGNVIEFNGEYNNFHVENLDHFKTNKLKVDEKTLKTEFEFTFPDVTATGFEDVRGHTFILIPVWGYGKFYVAPKDIVFSGNGTFSITKDGGLNLDDFVMTVKVGKLELNLENLLTGGDLSELLNNALADFIPFLLKNFPQEISDLMNDLLKPILNIFFNTVKVEQFM